MGSQYVESCAFWEWVNIASGLLRNSGLQYQGGFLLTLGKTLRFPSVEINALKPFSVGVEQRGHPVVVLVTPIFPKRLAFWFLGHESSSLLGRYPNRVAFGKGPKAPAQPRVPGVPRDFRSTWLRRAAHYGGVIPERISVLTCWMRPSDWTSVSLSPLYSFT